MTRPANGLYYTEAELQTYACGRGDQFRSPTLPIICPFSGCGSRTFTPVEPKPTHAFAANGKGRR